MQANTNQTGHICAKCKKRIQIENTVAFKNKNYHPECFICDGGCGKFLAAQDGGGGFFEQPDGNFCKDCFASKKAPKCKRCNKAVVEKVIRFDDGTWHPDCFICAGCRKSLEGQEITTVDGQPMCKNCYMNRFSEKCHNCNTMISPGQAFMDVGDGKIHAECFKCTDCGRKLAGEPCVKNGNTFICGPCSKRR